jgi:PmbA protein
MSNCAASEPEQGLSLYRGPDTGPEIPVFDPEVVSLSHEEREARCFEMYRLAAGLDERIVSVRQASFVNGFGETMYASSEGILKWQKDTFAACSVTIVMADGDSYEMGGASSEGTRIGDVDHLSAAREAVERTAMILGGTPLGTGVYDVVFDPDAAASLVESLGELFLSSSVYKNRSLLKGRMGEKFGSGSISIVDDGTIPWKTGSSSWDGEGVPSSRTILMDRGVVSSFLYDLKYAERFKAEPTGNASRSPGSLPGVGFSNLYLLPGERKMKDVLSDNAGGILVSELMGVHTIDPVSGDFSLGIKGALIEKGGIPGKAVAGMTIAGNLVTLLESISEIGSDLRFFGDIGGCPVVAKNVSMAGY